MWHNSLLFKLKHNGIDSLLTSYLTNRKQWAPVQSRRLPLLFLIDITNLEQGIKSNINFFADDTMMYFIIHNKFLPASKLKHDTTNEGLG